MHLIMVGLNHRTASVELREKLAFPEYGLGPGLDKLREYPHISEGVILSTCNRTEVYCVVDDREEGRQDILNFLESTREIDQQAFIPYTYTYASRDVIRHLFQVVSSLDSMVVGEPQIAGQVKNAYQAAQGKGCTGPILNRLFGHALSVGKRVRTETDIGSKAVSVSYVAVELAKKVFPRLEGCKAFLVGAGEMGELTARHLLDNGVREVLVASRSLERAERLAARFGGQAVPFMDSIRYMADVDIVITSSAAPHHLITERDVLAVMGLRGGRPLFLIDIAFPRNIDPQVGKIENVFLYDIDDLKSIADSHLEDRNKEATRAKNTIIETEVEEMASWLYSLEAVPTIKLLRQEVEKIRDQKTRKALARLKDLSDEDKDQIVALTKLITNAILHKPITTLKESANRKNGYIYLQALRHLFGLDDHSDRKTK
ncbi:glutamyl-tRNA reductase [Candidatus Hakubella thermalkaliphila]|uniref:Glutamyl-tRNA reductase n=2 Tax=Candidatus Hakubella thermalkaliphila TaxID=2754717 RepID=A0A6V8NLZ8_9ACTN|nr:glutamyl-tRNA reductase [Candidatus Hakubella thermalkaliphila]